MEGTGEIKYPGQTKTSTAALRLTEVSVKARGRKSRKKNHLVLQVGGCAKGQLPSVENICKLKTPNEGMKPEGLMDADESECKGIRVTNYVLAK
jgi:hypothetical protein